MAKNAKRAGELIELGKLIAQVVAFSGNEYRPTITDHELADAFDAAMAHIGNPTRAWRGSHPKVGAGRQP